jgi:hypothetical protein
MTINDHRAQGKPARSRRWAFNSRFLIGKPGNPMMERWRLIQTPLFGIYVHFIYREDLDPVPHDHPWWFASLVLRGGYEEQHWDDARATAEPSQDRFFGKVNYHQAGRWLGAVVARRWHTFPLHAAHRITRVEPGTVTLVVVGPKVRSWGFYDGGRFVDQQRQWREERDVFMRRRAATSQEGA